MYIRIDHNSGVPVSAQIVDQIKYLAVSGALECNAQLPSVRSLAAELKLNPTTVARAYRQLEMEGISFTMPGRGTFIAPRHSGLTGTEKRRRLKDDVRRLVVEAERLGFDDLLGMVRAEMEDLQGSSSRLLIKKPKNRGDGSA